MIFKVNLSIVFVFWETVCVLILFEKILNTYVLRYGFPTATLDSVSSVTTFPDFIG